MNAKENNSILTEKFNSEIHLNNNQIIKSFSEEK